ncbi:MAG: hypothetical protein LBG97_09905 [Coriobacteriales bacterium]|jgi:hypothetical protein|nr:hypothetical protein [Coriobacteriales bacterium]
MHTTKNIHAAKTETSANALCTQKADFGKSRESLNATVGCRSWQALLNIFIFALIIGGFALATLLLPRAEVLVSERRKPAELPTLNAENLTSAHFMKGFEPWAADAFAGREELRGLRAFTVFNVFAMTDKDGLYFGEAGAGKFEAIKRANFIKTVDKVEKVIFNLNSTANESEMLSYYYAIIPDKSIYDSRSLPGFSSALADSLLQGRLQGATQIPLADALVKSDFYRTDLHWDQAELAFRAQAGADTVPTRLMRYMGDDVQLARMRQVLNSASINDVGAFSGVYPGQLALNIPADRLRYVSSPVVEAMDVSYFDAQTETFVQGSLYDLDAAKGRDPYDLFLSGASPIIIIKNPDAVLSGKDDATGKELYLFRDSFGSSLAPLLACGYDKVTLIDLRYIDYRLLDKYIDFKPGSDVLFCYSSQIFNNPTVLLVQ